MNVVEFFELEVGDIVKTIWSPEMVVVGKEQSSVKTMDDSATISTYRFPLLDVVRKKSEDASEYTVGETNFERTATSVRSDMDDILMKVYKAGHYNGAHEMRDKLTKYLVLDPSVDWNEPSPCVGCEHFAANLKIGCRCGGCKKKSRYIEKVSLIEHFRKVNG